MKVIYGIKGIRKFRRPVVAMGVFDGVHRGHTNILKSAVRKAGSIKGTSVALTFWPHPQKKESLYSLEHRLRLIAALGIDVCIVINFDQNFAKISAKDFISNILYRKICASYVYVGKNFRFGKDARGDPKTLENLSKIYPYRLKVFGVIKIKGRPISSTFIRALIKRGRLRAAEKLLSRPVSVLGTVIRGNALGRKIGFSTANINPHHEVIPPQGVYAVGVIFRKEKFKGICNIGRRPTIKAQSAKRKAQNAIHIEVHIFNFQKKIYGEYLEIQFIKKIRDEKKFSSLPALAQQIQKDSSKVKAIFFHH